EELGRRLIHARLIERRRVPDRVVAKERVPRRRGVTDPIDVTPPHGREPRVEAGGRDGAAVHDEITIEASDAVDATRQGLWAVGIRGPVRCRALRTRPPPEREGG